MKKIIEDGEVPVNNASSGQIAGIGANGPNDVVVKKKPKTFKRFRESIANGPR